MPVVVTVCDWATFQALLVQCSTAIAAGGSSNLLLAIQSAAQAKAVAIGLGENVSASGTSQQLLSQNLDGLVGLIREALQLQANMNAGAQGRLIKAGVRNEGRRQGGDGVRYGP